MRRAADRRPATEQAMGELYHACYRRLVAQVYAFTADLAEAQDVVQEAFARALARPGGLTDIDSPEAWLRTVAVNVVRRRWRRRKLLDTILLRDRPIARLVEAAPGPERADLRQAMATLPDPFRQVVVLHYFADLPVDEISALLDVPTGTIKSRLSRARAALAERLGDYTVEGDGPADAVPPAGSPGGTEVAHA
jgi:RNA polymerase sigma-70 factor (ECF subfamily)